MKDIRSIETLCAQFNQDVGQVWCGASSISCITTSGTDLFWNLRTLTHFFSKVVINELLHLRGEKEKVGQACYGAPLRSVLMRMMRAA